MPPTLLTTALNALRYPSAANNGAEFAEGIENLADDTDARIENVAAKAGISSPATVRRGKCIIAGEESTTSTSYTTLTTPDRVQNIVLPEDGLIFVVYRALWRTVGAEAAIFLGANQVKAMAASSAGVDIAGSIENSSDSSYGQLITTATGLGGTTAYSSSASFSTTGQALGLRASHAATVGGVYTEDTSMPSDGWGGLCVIEAAAGTYDLSIRFRHVSGTTTYVKERKLRVWTQAF